MLVFQPCVLTDPVGSCKSWDILHVLSLDGCNPSCTTHVHNLQPGEIQFFHTHFASRCHSSQNQWLLEYFNSNCSRDSHSKAHSYIICGKPVCQKVWLSVLGLSLTRYYRIHSLYMEGKVMVETPHHRNMAQKSSEAVAWMGNYFEK